MAPASAQPFSGHQGGSAQSQRARALCSPLATAVGSVVSGGTAQFLPPAMPAASLGPMGESWLQGVFLLLVVS